jgi:ribosomal-protein-alanine N-acetyltransferase
VTLRPATPEDVPGLVALEAALFGPDAWSAATVLSELVGPGRHALVSVADRTGEGCTGEDRTEGDRTEEDRTEEDRTEEDRTGKDGLLGYVVTLRSGDVVDLQRIAVRPDHQRQGTARTLLDAALADARAAGSVRMLLEVSAANTPALALYAVEGFEEIDRRRRYYRDGTDAVVMARALEDRADETGG